MADNEERIYILSKQFCPSVDGWENAKESSMTRQQALDIMADALIKFKYLNTASADDIEECEKDAEVCLNALLRADI